MPEEILVNLQQLGGILGDRGSFSKLSLYYYQGPCNRNVVSAGIFADVGAFIPNGGAVMDATSQG